MIKRLPLLLALVVMFLVSIINVTPGFAQNEPTSTVDAAFSALSAKLGTTVTRNTVDTYRWSQNVYDGSLGCPQPGVAYSQTAVRGYDITIVYKGATYDYRANGDGSVFFECGANGPVANAPGNRGVGTPIPVVATAIPVSGPTAISIPMTTAVPVSGPTAVAAPAQTYTNPIAFIGADNNVYVTSIGNNSVTALTSDASATFDSGKPWYGQLAWSPDGTSLAFIDRGSSTVYVAQSGQKPQQVIRIPTSMSSLFAYPVFWLPNGQDFVYIWEPNNAVSAAGDKITLTIQKLSLNGGESPVLGQITLSTPNGSGGSDIADNLFEVGVGQGGHPHILLATANGSILYTLTSNGEGVGLFNANGKNWQMPNLIAPSLSPDGTKLVAIARDPQNANNVTLVSVDLGTGATSPINAAAGVNQTAWLDNNTLLYTTRVPAAPITLTTAPNANQQAIINQYRLGDANQYTTGLWKQPFNGGSPTQLDNQIGFGFGTPTNLPDGTIAYTVYPTLASVVSAVNNNQPATAIDQLIPRTGAMVALNPDNSRVSLGAGSQAVISKGTFMASAAAPAGQPPALAVGKNAVVITANGDTLNLRQTPSKGAAVVRILTQGTVVTIVGGPANADGLRWWQVKLSDGVSGWVVDQVNAINTLAPQ